jgi:hypothetical protein
MIRDERYHYIVNYSSSPRREFSPEARRPDSDYERTTQTADEIGLIDAHPDHPAMKRYVEWLQAPRPAEELYDTQHDPWQLKNLAARPEYLAIKARLKAQLELYQRQTKDPRITGEMAIFDRTRTFVEKRKASGYAR